LLWRIASLADIQEHEGQFHGHHQIQMSVVGVGQFEKVNYSVVGHSYREAAANSATANKLKNNYILIRNLHRFHGFCQILAVYIPVIEHFRSVTFNPEIRFNGTLCSCDVILARRKKQNDQFFGYLRQTSFH
jgi:hypothetical protein